MQNKKPIKEWTGRDFITSGVEDFTGTVTVERDSIATTYWFENGVLTGVCVGVKYAT